MSEVSEVIRNTVVWFSPVKGFGFVKVNSKENVFIHRRNFVDCDPNDQNLTAGETVEYQIGEFEGRRCATNVRKSAAVTEAAEVETA